jgi:peptidoglycan/xylan/chitin deacetylase (PgdA/CDA1 family)/SAM-dependent methyltransferase
MPAQENQIDGAFNLATKPARRSFVSRIPIVTYHNVGPAKPGAHPLLTVSPDRFAKQVRWLARHHYSSINTTDWLAWLTERRPIPERSVLITFDDGYEDIADYALPVLSRYGFKAVVYIVTGLIGMANEWDLRAGWGELRLMAHTRHHPDLRTLSQNELEDEVFGSAADLQKILGVAPTSFAYPYGHFNQAVRDCVAQVYQTSVTVVEGICSDIDDPNLMPRIWTRPCERLSRFARRVKAGKIEPVWKAALRHVPGIKSLRRRYLSVWEQYIYLSRIARERYSSPEPLFDDYQEDYSHDAAPEQERYQIIVDEVTRLRSRWGDAIEIGCSKGLFTTKLASGCDSVLACDISPRACSLTAERCTKFPNVKVKRLDVQRDAIIGEYDLVFVMDTLAYVHGRRRLRRVISELTRAIRVGGMLVFSDVRWPENIQKAWWQRWIPEGADQHVATLNKRSDLRLIYQQFHHTNGQPNSSYMDHLIAIFVKTQPKGIRGH